MENVKRPEEGERGADTPQLRSRLTDGSWENELSTDVQLGSGFGRKPNAVRL